MFQQSTNPHHEEQPSATKKLLRDPGQAAAYVSSADITAAWPGHTPVYRRGYHPPLPGMEGYYPPELPPPLELDNSSESLTRKLDQILQTPRRDFSSLTWDQIQTVLDYEESEGFGVGACLNIFPSGEMTGGCYSKGAKRAPGRTGKISSHKFTKQAKKAIRRAVESKITTFKLFITLTLDPKLSELTESGCVNQEWAKKRFKQFLNTLKKAYDRLADKTGNDDWRISYIWVAEIQELNTQNIHFHILVDRQFIDVKWLVKIWGQASNSVNIKRLNNQEHAVNYLLKYMKKSTSTIEGKRYGMTQNLIEGSKPVKLDFYGRGKRRAFLNIKDSLAWNIKQNGGYVADWGLSLPPPCRPRIWKDKNGNICQKPGVSYKVGKELLEMIHEAMATIDQELSYEPEAGNPDDLPF